ncbi:hypothetical protein ILUMI_10455 [Ignelater luminosus]|uniref:Major facilitator superfamily (MFS) profile domain-containing protein n=1 Tax=Ignelater luminosus TaxID=2038154 RepID=A0A8K0D733_IGNLU|nr:hypothetical protein ILUMI_10455 [Ignelater luminosus]
MQAGDLGYSISEDEISYVVMIAPLGYLVGSPLSGFLLDKIGRKSTMLLLAIPEIIPWILIETSTCVEMLYIARFITGIADGALFTTLPIYIGEVVEPKIRGILGTAQSFAIITGILLINAYGSYLPIRMTAYISLSVPLLFLVTFIWMPDSPYYLLMKGKIEEARASLSMLRRVNNVEKELSKIKTDVQRQISEPGRYKDIFTIKTNFKAFLILIGLRTFQQMSGLSALGFYTQVIFKQAGGYLSPAESTIVCCVIQVVFTGFTSFLLDHFGRRPLLLFSSAGSATTLIILGLYFSFQHANYDLSYFYWLPVAAMVIYNVVNSSGLLMVPDIMTGELMSVSVKSKAVGIVNIYLGIIMSFGSKLFQYLDYHIGMFMPFYVFGVCCIISIAFCYFWVPETKAKTLEQIQQTLKESKEVESAEEK